MLNSVGKKYSVGYIIAGLLMFIALVVSAGSGLYLSHVYSRATEELVQINELEQAATGLNDNINLYYLYLSAEGLENYAAAKEETQESLAAVRRQLEEDYLRELADTADTVETYLSLGNDLMESLSNYQNSSTRHLEDYVRLQSLYSDLQQVYSYVNLRFQDTYTQKLSNLSSMEVRLDRMMTLVLAAECALLLIICLFCAAYLYTVLRGIMNSIHTLMEGVESIRDNVFDAHPIEIHSRDEFEEFAAAYNHMLEIIRRQMTQIEENAAMKVRIAEVETENLRIYSELQKSNLNFLQSRVNPHFLFNTLNMISSIARMEEADQCADLMETTASLLRYNLDNISKTVTLEKEMENLKDYVAIQEARFDGRYTYHFDIDEDCLDVQMPCMVLQPLVENSIQHGIGMMLSGGGVWISCSRESSVVRMEVRDNGVGMSREQVEELYHNFESNTASSTHIGLRNIYQRLRLFYKEKVRFLMEDACPGLRIVILLPEGTPDNAEGKGAGKSDGDPAPGPAPQPAAEDGTPDADAQAADLGGGEI